MANGESFDLGAIWPQALAAGVTGFIGMIIGVKTQAVRQDAQEKRLDRVEKKLDALLQHFAIRGIEGDD